MNLPFNKEDFDAMLDRTLRARSQAGPRAGFHSRLAESLRQARNADDQRGGWWRLLMAGLSVAAVFAGFAVTFMMLHHRPMQRHSNLAHLAKPAEPQQGTLHFTAPASQREERRLPGRHVAAVRPVRADTAPVLAEASPKLDTFPSVTTEAERPFGSGDPVPQISPEAARAMLSLQQQQARPITLAAINVNRPLFGGNQ